MEKIFSGTTNRFRFVPHTRRVAMLPIIVAAVLSAPAWAAEELSSQARRVSVLGPDDQVSVQVRDVNEISDKPMRIAPSGFLTFPVIGKVRAWGSTPEELEAELANRLRPYVRNPEVIVTVTDYQSRPISVMGAVNHPGVQQVHGPRTLVETLSLAGGLADDAGYSVLLVRQREWGNISLPGVTTDSSNRYSAEIPVDGLLKARDPKLNVQVLPNDVITVPRARLIYVMGEVGKPGGFALKERESVTLLQALALAQGLSRLAAPQHARILRPGGESADVQVPLNRILAGKEPDKELSSDDILYIPSNGAKAATMRAIEGAIQVGTGIAIFRR
jgi:polysaccharide export outer membrane protein